MGAMAQQHEHSKTKKEDSTKKESYQCPMKCEGDKTYTKKGKCPKCTMDLKLVKK
jgi:transcription initiation factor IIE alpha subunit